MPKVQPEYLQQRRQQILDAAATCFARRGFHQSTMQHICEEAELSPGAVYRYFRSKDEIIEGICTMRREANAERIEGAITNGSTQDMLNQLIEEFFLNVDADDLQADCSLFIEVITEAPRNQRIRDVLQRSNVVLRERLMQLISRSQAEGDFDPALDPEGIARVMIALYHGFVTQKLVDPDFDVRGYVGVVKALFDGTFWRAAGGSPATTPAREGIAGALRH